MYIYIYIYIIKLLYYNIFYYLITFFGPVNSYEYSCTYVEKNSHY